MAKLIIELDLDGAAFDPEPGPEIARIITLLADTLRDLEDPKSYKSSEIPLHDINGNTCGKVTLAL